MAMVALGILLVLGIIGFIYAVIHDVVIHREHRQERISTAPDDE